MATSTIYFNRAGTARLDIGNIDFAHYAKVTLKIGGTVIHTSANLPTNQDYYDWTISEEEKAQIFSLLPTTSPSVAGTMKVDVFWSVNDRDANLYDKEYDVSFVLEETSETKPTIDSTSKAPLLLTDYVQGKTKLRYTINATAKNGASIKTATLKVGGSSCTLVSNSTGVLELESAWLTRSGTNSITATVTDTRGFTRTITDSIYVYAYAPPILTPISSEGGTVCRRWRPDTNSFDEMHGTQCRVAVNVYASYIPNLLTGYSIYYRFRKSGTEIWSEELIIGTRSITQTGLTAFTEIITDGTALDESNVLVGQFGTESEYDIEIKVIDELGEANTRYELLPCQETSFNIKANGMGIGAGKYATKDKCFDSAWDIHSDENIEADGDVIIGGSLHIAGTEVTASATDLNQCSGSSSNLQTQINTLLTQINTLSNSLSSVKTDLNSTKTTLNSVKETANDVHSRVYDTGSALNVTLPYVLRKLNNHIDDFNTHVNDNNAHT